MPESPASPDHVRILIAGGADHLRRRIREMFTHDRWCRVVGEVASPHEIEAACLNLSPDILFLGLDGVDNVRDGASALTALRRTVRTAPFVGVIVLVAGDTAEELLGPLRAGARGVLLRDAPTSTLLEAVGDVVAGSAALDPRLTATIFEYLAAGSGFIPADAQRPKMDTAVLQALSPREGEVLHALARGQRNEEIAAQLGISVGTVKTHLRHIYHKLGVPDRTSAVLAAFQLRLPEAVGT